MRSDEFLKAELLEVLGEDGAIALAQRFGGTRLYIPQTMHSDHEIAVAVGLHRALKLVQRFAPDTLRVPLFKQLRAIDLRRRGYSNAQIAVAFTMAEPAINRLFRRLRISGIEVPDKPTLENVDG